MISLFKLLLRNLRSKLIELSEAILIRSRNAVLSSPEIAINRKTNLNRYIYVDFDWIRCYHLFKRIVNISQYLSFELHLGDSTFQISDTEMFGLIFAD